MKLTIILCCLLISCIALAEEDSMHEIITEERADIRRSMDQIEHDEAVNAVRDQTDMNTLLETNEIFSRGDRHE